MGCGTTCLKIFLVTVNIIFFLAGAGILGVGLWLRFDSTIEQFAGDQSLAEFRTLLYTSAYILIGFGAFTFIVGFCGCCGAIKDNKCMLGVYIFLVTIVLAAEIAGGVYAYVKRDSLTAKFAGDARTFLKTEYNQTSTAGQSWNFAMVYFNCCGVDGAQDFENSMFANNTRYQVPIACCVQKPDALKNIGKPDWKPDAKDWAQCELSNASTEYRNNAGCLQKLEEFVETNAAILLGVAGGIAGFELLVVVAAVCFCCNMDKDD